RLEAQVELLVKRLEAAERVAGEVFVPDHDRVGVSGCLLVDACVNESIQETGLLDRVEGCGERPLDVVGEIGEVGVDEAGLGCDVWETVPPAGADTLHAADDARGVSDQEDELAVEAVRQ